VTQADARGLSRFNGLQAPYSLIERTVEGDLLPMAQALDLAAVTWEALGGGLLSGRHGSNAHQRSGTRLSQPGYDARLSPRNLVIADAVNDVAQRRGVPSAQVAIAWILARRDRGTVIPIVGARASEQLESNLGAVELRLEPDELEALDTASAPQLPFPHDFVGRSTAYGESGALVDGHRPRAWHDVP
jgi:aryl-alcohol dehydrogenase-like predicted oxidoreductase